MYTGQLRCPHQFTEEHVKPALTSTEVTNLAKRCVEVAAGETWFKIHPCLLCKAPIAYCPGGPLQICPGCLKPSCSSCSMEDHNPHPCANIESLFFVDEARAHFHFHFHFNFLFSCLLALIFFLLLSIWYQIWAACAGDVVSNYSNLS